MSEETTDPDLKLIEKHCSDLGEHFDSVRIICTKHVGEVTITEQASSGVGNFYAQLGSVREWLLMQDQLAKEKAKEESGEDDE